MGEITASGFFVSQIEPLEQEGCYCTSGTVLDDESGECVSDSECGTCTDADGAQRRAGEEWEADRCTRCSCKVTQGTAEGNAGGCIIAFGASFGCYLKAPLCWVKLTCQCIFFPYSFG